VPGGRQDDCRYGGLEQAVTALETIGYRGARGSSGSWLDYVLAIRSSHTLPKNRGIP
jgi:hypothetical protein